MQIRAFNDFGKQKDKCNPEHNNIMTQPYFRCGVINQNLRLIKAPLGAKYW